MISYKKNRSGLKQKTKIIKNVGVSNMYCNPTIPLKF